MNYSLTVNKIPVEVYTETVYPAPYNKTAQMECAMFFFNGSAELEIKSEIKVQSAVVRPLSCGIKAELTDGVIRLRLDKPQKLSLEINGSYENNLVIFAECDRQPPQGKQIRIAGRVEREIFEVHEDNSIVFFETDAVLAGKLLIKDCKNVTVCGFGKVCMTDTEWSVKPVQRRRAVEVIGCENVTVRDIRISDSVDWSLRVMGSENVTVDNVKIIGCRGNSDGVDICGSKNVTVKNIFTRTWDDSFVLKALDTGDAENVTFCDSVLWNDFARPLEVGVELRADNVRNITFENLDIIHSPTGYPLMGIHHGDRARVRNITFRNIRIEDTPGAQLFDIRIAKSFWNRDDHMGDIADVCFKDICFIGKPGMEFALSKSRIEGYSSEHGVKNVTLDNISILGKTATTPYECGVNIMDYVEDVKVTAPVDSVKMNPVTAVLSVCTPFEADSSGIWRGRFLMECRNDGAAESQGRIWLQVSPTNTAEYDSQAFNYRLAAGERIQKIYDVAVQAGRYYFCVQSDNPDVRVDWLYKEFDLLLDNSPRSMRLVNYYGNLASAELSVCDGGIVIKSDVLKDKCNRMIVYGAMPVEDVTGQVKFSAEETDFGEAPAVLKGKNGYELAPQLRCPAEITLVFKNEPKVETISRVELCTDTGTAVVPFKALGVHGNNFWLEIAADIPEVRKYRYPLTMFHSVKPEDTAHMFANVIIRED